MQGKVGLMQNFLTKKKISKGCSSAELPLHSCDYFKKISIKINVEIDEGNSRNEI